MRKLTFVFYLLIVSLSLLAQEDSLPQFHPDSSLRIINLNPFFSLHVDSALSYQLQINKNPENYFWYLKNAPVGLKIGKDDGMISFKASKAYFLSGKLKYDVPYKVSAGVQNLADAVDKVDTSFNIIFFNTEVIPSKIKPTVYGSIWIDEGETITFRVMCESGNFPIESVMMSTSAPIKGYSIVQKCGDEFNWTPGYEVAKPTDTGKVKAVVLSFIGSTKMGIRDTATVRIFVRDAVDQPMAVQEFNQVTKNIDNYVLQLKYTFLQLDKKLKKTKNVRTTFDLTAASTSLTGTVLSTSSDGTSQRTGKILPSIGLALVPIKEAAVPNKSIDQNQASQIRSSIKRLEYMRQDNQLINEKDPEVIRKTAKLKDEIKQVQMQLIDVPLDFTSELSAEELNQYFNSPKVNKKYRLKG
ncbi:MAG: hypothetical protein JWR72_931 [Flavisolibacter sp.]|jgi:hypothetical protein|nr:hypothetical protein [Flavisolibacter sp.]